MHNFKKDFKFMQILGLDNAYLKALRNKASIFGRQSENNLNYFYFTSNSTDLEQMNNYLSIMDEYTIFIDEINTLPDTYTLMKIALNADYFLFNFTSFISSLDKNFICSIPRTIARKYDWIVNFDRQDVENLKKEVEDASGDVRRFSNIVNSYSKQYPILEPIARKIRIITKPTENTLKIMDYSLEYALYGERKVMIKALAQGVETIPF